MKSTILKEFIKYCSLNVIGMIGLSCYILADTYFISKGLGANGLTALNLAIPIYSFINGAGLMIGMGGGIKYSIRRGLGDFRSGDTVFTHSILLAAGFAVLFFLSGVFFPGNIARLAGANAEVFDMTKTYLQVILLFSPMFLLNNLLLCYVRNDGAPQLAMAAMLAGSFSNIILDYIFIFPLNMGIFGAVFATGLAPVISVLTLFPYFFRKRNHFHLAACSFSLKTFAGIFSGGLPSLVTELSSGTVIIIFNMLLLDLAGNIGVAAYGVIANLSLVVLSVYTGISQGIQPLLSRSYGAGRPGEIRIILRYAAAAVFIISGVIMCCVFFGSSQIAGLFNSRNDVLLQRIAEKGMKIYFTACPFAGLNIILSVFFTSIECPRPAHAISLLRGFVLIIPMAFLLASLAGINGVWSSFPVTEVLAAAAGLFLFLRRRKLSLHNPEESSPTST